MHHLKNKSQSSHFSEASSPKHLQNPNAPNPNPEGPNIGGAGGSIIVFRRLPDSEYIEITNKVPKVENNLKEILYEQIDNAETETDQDGKITHVKFYDKNNIKRSYPVGGNIIIESADLIYVKGCLDKTSVPKNFTPMGKGTCIGAKVVLPNNENRIIEGNLTFRKILL